MPQHDVTFLLVPKFSMIALYGALEPLRVANRFAGPVFSWRFISASGQPVAASNDIPVSVSGRLADIGRPAMTVVCASYEQDKGMTCAGGAAAIDMMLDWIGRLLGRALAVGVADQLVHFRSLEAPDQARLPARARYQTEDRRLLAIIKAMEEQTEDPLDAATLAKAGGISVRQMERLFHHALGERPIGFYLKLRLEKAERLLTYSDMSIRDVALACGFSSLPLFSRSFSARFGKPPSHLRNA